jgi:hypothetical protein
LGQLDPHDLQPCPSQLGLMDEASIHPFIQNRLKMLQVLIGPLEFRFPFCLGRGHPPSQEALSMVHLTTEILEAERS